MEHPGFDFSQATVNGGVPDAREFMGGITQQRWTQRKTSTADDGNKSIYTTLYRQ